MPPKTATRCAYHEAGKRCPRNGVGSPPLCPRHKALVKKAQESRAPTTIIGDLVSDFLQGKPINREAIFGAVQEMSREWQGGIGGDYRPPVDNGQSENQTHTRQRDPRAVFREWAQRMAGQGRQHSAPPPDDEQQRRVVVNKARRTLGFPLNTAVSEDAIKKRHRELAKKWHPDLGSAADRTMREAKMRDINAAVDVLMAAL